MGTSLQQTPCLHNYATFSKGHSYFVLNCGGPGVPELTIREGDNKLVEVWESNRGLVERLQETAIPKSERFTVPIDGGFTAQVKLYLPPNMDRSGDVKYPMLVNV